MVVRPQRSGNVIVALMMLTVQSACVGSSDSDSSDAVQAVSASLKAVDVSSLAFHEGPLQGGTAVLADNAAYWVKGRASICGQRNSEDVVAVTRVLASGH